VDGSIESAAALRWACREASIRGAEVHAVHVREELCRSLANYAVPAQPTADDLDDVSTDIKDLVASVQADQDPPVEVHLLIVDGLAARVLLEQCVGADMLVLGTSLDVPGTVRSAGPVIRACLRRAPCPVVVISGAQDPSHLEDTGRRESVADGSRAKIPAIVGV
jgi:nucleotide-binding universal stress UspA family protein